jgi:D-alanyl-D-alanine carboxypeptidase/D-alanyl-D-alanine-endopeptidase (penicillin-binding protein 4)
VWVVSLFGACVGALALIEKVLRERGIKRVTEGLSVSPDFSFNFSESAEQSAVRLSNFLRLGKTQTGVEGGSSSASADQSLCVLDSYPLRDILLYMNARSSNFIAERIGGMVGGAEAVQQFLINELKLPADQVTIERTSGREHNRMTPRGILVVLRALVVEAKRQGLQPEDIMAVVSDDKGTLRRRLAGTGLEGAVVAKTGTLTPEVDGGMASLAGLVYTKEGGEIVFAILDQGNRISDSRQMEDQLLTEVVTMQNIPRVVGNQTPRQLLPASDLHIQTENATQ